MLHSVTSAVRALMALGVSKLSQNAAWTLDCVSRIEIDSARSTSMSRHPTSSSIHFVRSSALTVPKKFLSCASLAFAAPTVWSEKFIGRSHGCMRNISRS